MIDQDRIMAALDDDPEPIDTTIDRLSIPALIEQLDPADWPEFGLHHPFDPGAGYREEALGLYDLAIACQKPGFRSSWPSFLPERGTVAPYDEHDTLTGCQRLSGS